MRVLVIGGSGNLGSRLVPAVIAHGHQPYIFLRSKAKLQSKLSPTLFEYVQSANLIIEGDALDSAQIQQALEHHEIRHIINVAGTRDTQGHNHTMHRIVVAVAQAATNIKNKKGGSPLRVWNIGGLGSVRYPGTPNGGKLEDYMPAGVTEHHRATVEVLRNISTGDVRWTLLCVAMMYPRDKDGDIQLLEQPRGNGLRIGVGAPPEWKDSIVKWIPVAGVYLNLWVVVLSQYKTYLEDVADFLASEIGRSGEEYVGQLVAMKDVGRV